MTEAGPNGILLYPEEHLEKAGSIGKNPTVNMEIRVVRPDGTDTAPNEYGEILLTGDSLMLGYDNNPDETNAAMKDGWLYTGDIAYRDKDGYFYIVDRKKMSSSRAASTFIRVKSKKYSRSMTRFWNPVWSVCRMKNGAKPLRLLSC